MTDYITPYQWKKLKKKHGKSVLGKPGHRQKKKWTEKRHKNNHREMEKQYLFQISKQNELWSKCKFFIEFKKQVQIVFGICIVRL